MASSKLTICKHCGAEIAKSAKTCPNCGGKNKKPLYLRPWFIILVVIIIFGAFGSKKTPKTNSPAKIGTVEQESKNNASAPDKPSNANTSESTGSVDSQEKSEKPADTKAPEPTPEPKTVFNVGDILLDGDTQIVYIASGDYQEDNPYLQPKEGYKYIFLELAFINQGKSDVSVSFYSFDAYADGYHVDQYYGSDDGLSATLSAGRSTSGKIYFEVPNDAQEIEIEYSPNAFLDKKIKFMFEGDLDSGYELESNLSRSESAIQVGETYESRTLCITYLSVDEYVSDNMFVQPKDGFRFVSLTLEFENLGQSDELISSFSFDCYADGIACDASYIRDDDLQATISAGRKAKGTVTFEVPLNAEVIEAEFNNNVWTSDRIVFTVK